MGILVSLRVRVEWVKYYNVEQMREQVKYVMIGGSQELYDSEVVEEEPKE